MLYIYMAKGRTPLISSKSMDTGKMTPPQLAEYFFNFAQLNKNPCLLDDEHTQVFSRLLAGIRMKAFSHEESRAILYERLLWCDEVVRRDSAHLMLRETDVLHHRRIIDILQAFCSNGIQANSVYESLDRAVKNEALAEDLRHAAVLTLEESRRRLAEIVTLQRVGV